jgi:hypothetical protein
MCERIEGVKKDGGKLKGEVKGRGLLEIYLQTYGCELVRVLRESVKNQAHMLAML